MLWIKSKISWELNYIRAGETCIFTMQWLNCVHIIKSCLFLKSKVQGILFYHDSMTLEILRVNLKSNLFKPLSRKSKYFVTLQFQYYFSQWKGDILIYQLILLLPKSDRNLWTKRLHTCIEIVTDLYKWWNSATCTSITHYAKQYVSLNYW